MDLVTKRHKTAKEKVTKTYIIFALTKKRSLEMCITRQNM